MRIESNEQDQMVKVCLSIIFTLGVIAVIVYLSAFSMLIKTMLSKRIKHDHGNVNAEPAPAADKKDEAAGVTETETEKGGQK